MGGKVKSFPGRRREGGLSWDRVTKGEKGIWINEKGEEKIFHSRKVEGGEELWK